MNKYSLIAKKFDRFVSYGMIRLFALFRNRWASDLCISAYCRWGMRLNGGRPRYISWRTDFDGTDFGLIEVGEGCTISSFCRILTHDWSPDTVIRGLHPGLHNEQPFGRVSGVRIGRYSFVGTNSVVMPGAVVGDFCIIGAGSVVRGIVPDYSIYIGSPGQVIGDTRDLVSRYLKR